MDYKKTGLTFAEAFERLRGGICIRRAEWLGYWEPTNDGNILMHCKDGRIFSMKDGCIPMFTLENTLAFDWIEVDSDHRAELDKIHNAHLLAPAANQEKAEKILNENK